MFMFSDTHVRSHSETHVRSHSDTHVRSHSDTHVRSHSDTPVRSHSDCTRKLEHYLSHLSWNNTLKETLVNRAYPGRITFSIFTLFWNSNMALSVCDCTTTSERRTMAHPKTSVKSTGSRTSKTSVLFTKNVER